MQQKRDTEATPVCLLLLLYLLLDGVIFELGGKNRAETASDGVETTRGLIGIENDELREHKIAEGANVVLVLDAGDNSVEKVEDVDTGEGCFH